MNRPPRVPRQERAPGPNFLDPSLRLTFSFDDELAAEHLPSITQEDLRSRKEKYRLFLGKTFYNSSSNEAIVSIQGLLDCENDARYYTESLLEIVNVNMSQIKDLVDDIKTYEAGYEDMTLVGEVHTHPILPHETPSVDHQGPSSGDIEAYVDLYRKGEMTGDSPFIFGVGSPNPNGETGYTFWRVIQKKSGIYDIEQLSLN